MVYSVMVFIVFPFILQWKESSINIVLNEEYVVYYPNEFLNIIYQYQDQHTHVFRMCFSDFSAQLCMIES